MKPIYLTMSAFGPFKNEVNIDFRKLGSSGIFLITGDTGSGKTSIFDAISYALYGEVSGSNRQVLNIRSDFSEKEKTYVELVFEHKNNIYKIYRTPQYERLKERGTGTTTNKQEAVLEVFNKTENMDKIISSEVTYVNTYSGIQPVNEKMIEILGINAKQFKQVSMLAQGEFLKILFAESEDRTQTFRRIFATYLYEDLGNNLKNKVKIEKQELENVRSIFKTHLNNIKLSLPNIDIENIQFNEQEINIIFKNMDQLIVQKKENYDSFQKKLEENKAKLEKLSKEIQDVEEENKKIIQYTELLKQKNELEDRKESFIKTNDKINKQKVLSNKVDPIFKDLTSKEQEINKIEEDVKALTQNLDIINKKKEQNKEKEAIIQEISKTIEDYNKNLELDKNISSTVAILTELKNLNEEKINKSKTYSIKEKEFNTNNSKYIEEEEKFFREQAGIIAERLEENKPCPVCGSTFHPCVAKKSTETLSKSELDKLKQQLNKSEKEFNDIKNQVLELNIKIENQINLIPESKDKDFSIEEFRNKTANEYTVIKKQQKQYVEAYSTQAKKAGISEDIDSIDINKYKDDFNNFVKNLNDDYIKYSTLLEANNKSLEEKKNEFSKILKKLENELKENGYNSKDEYLSNLIKDQDVEKFLKEYEAYNKEVIVNNTKLEEAKKQISGKEVKDLTKQKEEKEKISLLINTLEKDDKNLFSELSLIKETSKKVKELSKTIIEKSNRFVVLEDISKIINGNSTRTSKVSFEQFVQATYFDMVLQEANKRLIKMTDSRYKLVRKKEGIKASDKFGLDLNVLDNYNGKIRDVKSLSRTEKDLRQLLVWHLVFQT